MIAFLILQGMKTEALLTESHSHVLAVRAAYRLGLHRDPAPLNLEPQIKELRRRLWWHIISVEAFICVTSSTPLIAVDINRSDVHELSEVQDHYIGIELEADTGRLGALDTERSGLFNYQTRNIDKQHVSEANLVAKSRAHLARMHQQVAVRKEDTDKITQGPCSFSWTCFMAHLRFNCGTLIAFINTFTNSRHNLRITCPKYHLW